ncbi:MAG TPA: hypothetical protein P5044_10250, partial [bacterium]|nr:hypothetical protein [bacterium]
MQRLIFAFIFFSLFISCGGDESSWVNEEGTPEKVETLSEDFDGFESYNGRNDMKAVMADLRSRGLSPENAVNYELLDYSATPVYAYDFESSEQGWTTGLYGSSVLWTRKADIAGTALGTNAMVNEHNGTIVHNWMKSPVLNFTGLDNIALVLKVWLSDENGGCYNTSYPYDNKDLRICEDDGMGGVVNCQNLSCAWNNDAQWHEYRYDVSNWKNKTNVVLMFRYNTVDGIIGSGWAVDDIKIFKSTVPPDSAAADPQKICYGGTSKLNATAAGSTISWYTQQTGGS